MNYLSAINLSHPTWDVVLIAVLLAISFLYGMLAGQSRLVIVLFSIYLAYLLNNLVSLGNLSSQLQSQEFFILRAILFVALGIIIFLLLSRSLAVSYLKFRKNADTMLEVFLLSFSEVGLAAAIIFSFMPKKIDIALAFFTNLLFASDNALLIWTIIPLVVIFWIGKKSR